MNSEVILIISFFLIAMCYSATGLGGGSSYLTVLAFAGIGMTALRPTALLCNIIVVTGSTFLFQKAKYIDLKKALPLIVPSIPMAFVGGYWPITQSFFFILLGASLLVSAILLWFQPTFSGQSNVSGNPLFNGLIGGGIGLLAGLVGIGGGIFLAPLLHLVRWNDAKSIAAMASLFILVNSVAGLAGQFMQSNFQIDFMFILPLLGSVFAGGQIGSRLTINWFDNRVIKRITAVLIFIVAVRIFYQQLI